MSAAGLRAYRYPLTVSAPAASRIAVYLLIAMQGWTNRTPRGFGVTYPRSSRRWGTGTPSGTAGSPSSVRPLRRPWQHGRVLPALPGHMVDAVLAARAADAVGDVLSSAVLRGRAVPALPDDAGPLRRGAWLAARCSTWPSSRSASSSRSPTPRACSCLRPGLLRPHLARAPLVGALVRRAGRARPAGRHRPDSGAGLARRGSRIAGAGDPISRSCCCRLPSWPSSGSCSGVRATRGRSSMPRCAAGAAARRSCRWSSQGPRQRVPQRPPPVPGPRGIHRAVVRPVLQGVAKMKMPGEYLVYCAALVILPTTGGLTRVDRPVRHGRIPVLLGAGRPRRHERVDTLVKTVSPDAAGSAHLHHLRAPYVHPDDTPGRTGVSFDRRREPRTLYSSVLARMGEPAVL